MKKRLHGTTPTGAIFALKNMGWKDSMDYKHGGIDGKPMQMEHVWAEEDRKAMDAVSLAMSKLYDEKEKTC